MKGKHKIVLLIGAGLIFGFLMELRSEFTSIWLRAFVAAIAMVIFGVVVSKNHNQ